MTKITSAQLTKLISLLPEQPFEGNTASPRIEWQYNWDAVHTIEIYTTKKFKITYIKKSDKLEFLVFDQYFTPELISEAQHINYLINNIHNN